MDIKIPSLIISHPQLNSVKNPLGYRNWIRNACFNVQSLDENSITIDTSLDYKFICDGWFVKGSGNVARKQSSLEISKSVEGAPFYLEFSNVLQTSPSSLIQIIPDCFNLLRKKISLSFYVKRETLPALPITVLFEVNRNGSSFYSKTFTPTTINTTSVWERVVLTEEIEPTPDNTSGDYIGKLSITLPEGNTKITGIQLEVGDNASSLEYLPAHLEEIYTGQIFLRRSHNLSLYYPEKDLNLMIYYPIIMSNVPFVSLDISAIGSKTFVVQDGNYRYGFVLRVSETSGSESSLKLFNDVIKYRAYITY